MRSMRIVGVAAMLAVTLTACSKSDQPDANPTQTGPAPSGSATTAATAVGAPVNLGPCELVTQQEASALTGAAFGPGQEEDTPGPNGEKRCTYGARTKNVFIVAVIRAASVAEAQAARDELRSEAEQNLGTQLTVTKVSGVGDDAESISGSLSDIGVNVGALYVLKGTVGFALIDETNGPAPSVQALIAQANTVLGRL
jgi:PBP1b-binding outer membrane lipoprotein LpoB